MKRSPGQRIELQGDAMETATRTDSHDQRPSDALRKKERKKKLLKKRPKTRQSISTRTKDKNVFKVMPWEQASAAAREIKASR